MSAAVVAGPGIPSQAIALARGAAATSRVLLATAHRQLRRLTRGQHAVSPPVALGS